MLLNLTAHILVQNKLIPWEYALMQYHGFEGLKFQEPGEGRETNINLRLSNEENMNGYGALNENKPLNRVAWNNISHKVVAR